MREITSLFRTVSLTLVAVLFFAGMSFGEEAAQPTSPHGNLDIACSACHTTSGWGVLRADMGFDHRKTPFPLIGQHEKVSCRSCHPTLVFKEAKTACADCHTDIHSGQFVDPCSKCHTPDGWSNHDAMRIAHQMTRFPLVGVHAALDCQACHNSGRYANISTNCDACHLTTYLATKNPDHQAAGFQVDCSGCHKVTDGGWLAAKYHHTDTFPLSGGHSGVSCDACHIAGRRYALTSADCYQCHRNNYETTQNPNHQATNFPKSCQTCHTINGWRPATFDHSIARFQLTGKHLTVACLDCHVGNKYTGTPSDCYSCHQADFLTAADPNHQQNLFDHTCTKCHSTNGWKPSTFNHAATSFPLTGIHVTTECIKCHVAGQYSGLSADCYSCHQQDFQSVKDPDHVGEQFSHNCYACHETTGWIPAQLDHNRTAFPLTGKHVTVDCEQCHINKVYKGTSKECYGCHKSDYEKVADPNHVTDNFARQCTDCHTTNGWTPAQFDHGLTRFPLTGKHVTVDCAKCHVGKKYDGTARDCYPCHQNDYEGVLDPKHTPALFSQLCTNCHTTDGWQPAKFDHAVTTFPLLGAHLTTDCAKCHINGKFTGTDKTCWACHQTDYNGVTDPNHKTAQFSQICNDCHSFDAWKPSTFDHAKTQFPLVGAHHTVDCAKCHINGKFAGTDKECYPCHKTDFEGVTDPNHATNQFSQICTDCHDMNGWKPSTFDHAKTTFPLAGAHVTTDCIKCHVGGKYKNVSTDCYACHQQDFDGAKDPDHSQNQFGHLCSDCHSFDAWKPSTFDHGKSQFPLLGAHLTTECVKCHVNGVFKGTSTDCYACHQQDFDGVNDPSHSRNQFSHLCSDCHSFDAWKPATFDHSKSQFPLLGAHLTTECVKCHVNGVFKGTSTDCYACHQQDFDGVNDPSHSQNQFSHLCSDCHSFDAWKPATFDHDQAAFKLTGAHTTVECSKCHIAGKFKGTPQDCFTCHQPDYDGAATPNHKDIQMPHGCTDCHTTQAWKPSTFVHANFWQLTGKHTTADCGGCHKNGQFAGTSKDCFTCHQADYNNSVDPKHSAANLAHTCADCHNTNGWAGAKMATHDAQYFPIYAGNHRQGRWDTCNTCHIDNTNYAIFSCTVCHAKNKMDNEHRGKAGYVYDSVACLNCHPRGGGGDRDIAPQPASPGGQRPPTRQRG